MEEHVTIVEYAFLVAGADKGGEALLYGIQEMRHQFSPSLDHQVWVLTTLVKD